MVLEAEYAPTVVVKKSAFTLDETLRWGTICATLPRDLPAVTYLPYGMTGSNQSAINQFLAGVSQSPDRVRTYINQSRDDISPCTDDKPYFYKKDTGIPGEYLWLLAGTVGINVLVVWLPFRVIRRNSHGRHLPRVALPLTIFDCIGIGFMIVEVSLFQKLVLYLGSPTISLSILLSSLLVGMGTGSYFGRNMFGADVRKRLHVVSIAIVVVGILLFAVSPGSPHEKPRVRIAFACGDNVPAHSPACLLAGNSFPFVHPAVGAGSQRAIHPVDVRRQRFNVCPGFGARGHFVYALRLHAGVFCGARLLSGHLSHLVLVMEESHSRIHQNLSLISFRRALPERQVIPTLILDRAICCMEVDSGREIQRLLLRSTMTPHT